MQIKNSDNLIITLLCFHVNNIFYEDSNKFSADERCVANAISLQSWCMHVCMLQCS